jgi:histidinol-phosphatase (PHP family)
MKDKTGLFFKADKLAALPMIEQHIHTKFTDGENSPEEIVAHAIDAGFSQVIFTEHVQRGSSWYPDFAKEIERIKDKYYSKIDIVLGLEAKQINQVGDLDCTDSQKALADVVLGSVHGYPTPAEGEFYDLADLAPEEALALELENCLKLINRAAGLKMDIIGHPLGVYIRNYRKTVPRGYWENILTAVKNNHIAFDLNFKYHRDHFKVIWAAAEKIGALISVGSDVHSLTEFGQAIKEIKKL